MTITTEINFHGPADNHRWIHRCCRLVDAWCPQSACVDLRCLCDQYRAAFASYDEQLRAEALVSAALELTAYQQLNSSTIAPNQRRVQLSYGAGGGCGRIQSEAARIDLNAAPKQLLAGLFRTLGARPENADTYADRVIGWRTALPEIGIRKPLPIGLHAWAINRERQVPAH